MAQECLRVSPQCNFCQRGCARAPSPTPPSPFSIVSPSQRVLQKHNKSLRRQVDDHEALARLLHTWVLSQQPASEPSTRAPWNHSTLLANAAGRRHGLQWLSDKVYHNAVASMPRAAVFGASVQDAFRFTLHTTPDHDDVAAMETHLQHTFFANVKDVARVIWGCEHPSSPLKTYVVATDELVEQVHDRLIYNHGVYQGTGTDVRRIVSWFEDAHRIVITFTLLTEDECFPVARGQIRTHGFCWVIVERVTHSVSLLRHSVLHFKPVTADGPASLDDIGRMYNLHRGASQPRHAFVEQIRSAAEAAARDRYQTLLANLSQVLDL
ncbi:Aste57867_5295 [Aphanomyces stellatus]|uniref:Aste57867_5295 protein n=1 Tax=Aphanomyces stellatus TaxID=120398 RepID=A0A485KHC3_9STRA|nr:hypothetical protein As57867_005282 [Aphanomyces stellatus]VFT82362.1 Aste57867_5295 [Aphanomyces stellatus]